MSDPYDLKAHIRSVKDYPIAGVEFRDITSLLETPAAFVTACNAMTNICRDFQPTSVVAIESRGFIFAGPMAHELGLPFVLARKPGKLPNPAFARSFELEYGSTALEIQKNTAIGSCSSALALYPRHIPYYYAPIFGHRCKVAAVVGKL